MRRRSSRSWVVVALAAATVRCTSPVAPEAVPLPPDEPDAGAVFDAARPVLGGQGDAGPEACEVALPGEWVFVSDASADPFAARRPRVAACGEGAVRPLPTDPTQLEIELANCRLRYASVSQGARCPGAVGDRLRFSLHHLALVGVSEDVAEAYVALAVNGTVVWETRIPIPAGEETHVAEVMLTEPFDVGAPLVLHVDNHGENSYAFSPLLLSPP